MFVSLISGRCGKYSFDDKELTTDCHVAGTYLLWKRLGINLWLRENEVRGKVFLEHHKSNSTAIEDRESFTMPDAVAGLILPVNPANARDIMAVHIAKQDPSHLRVINL